MIQKIYTDNFRGALSSHRREGFFCVSHRNHGAHRNSLFVTQISRILQIFFIVWGDGKMRLKIGKIFKEGELEVNSVRKESLLTAADCGLE